MGHYESSAKRKVHSTKCLQKENEEISHYRLVAHLKALEQKEVDSSKKKKLDDMK